MTKTAATSSVLGMRVAHRMMRRELDRLTVAAAGIAAGNAECPDVRAAALDRWIRLLDVEIRHHHEVEDLVAWPVAIAHAGPHLDVKVLTDDHPALDPMLIAVRDAACALVAGRGAARRQAAGGLATTLAALADHLAEHVAAEEASVFPVIESYVPPAAWARVEQAAGRGGPGLGFLLPRALDVMTEAEHAAVLGSAPAARRVVVAALARVLVARHRRRERLVFGRTAGARRSPRPVPAAAGVPA